MPPFVTSRLLPALGSGEAATPRTSLLARRYALRFGPHTLLEEGDWDRAERLLTDPRFLEAKAEAGLAFELTAVARLSAERSGLRLLRLLEKCMRRVLHFVAAHPETLFQSL